MQIFLGFDVGYKRTGVAIANGITKTAVGITTINHSKDGKINWAAIDKIMIQYRPNQCIIGLALKNGDSQESSLLAQSFAKQLIKRYQVSVVYVDEYLTSNEAKAQLRWNYRHSNARRAEVDKQAATIILQTFLDNNGRTN